MSSRFPGIAARRTCRTELQTASPAGCGEKSPNQSGDFAGKTGIAVKESPSLRAVLTLEAIMKSFSVEVAGDELEMVS